MIAIIPFEDEPYFKELLAVGYKAVLKKNRIEIEIETDHSEQVDISRFPPETEYYFDLYECGGGKTKTGLSEIICGMDGEKLKPIKTYNSGHLANKAHAKFLVCEAVCIVCSKNGKVYIAEYRFAKERKKMSCLLTFIWTGMYYDLPTIYSIFKDAVKAAHEKANCFHCREPHYIKE